MPTPMRVLIIPDKFKGSLKALQAAQAIERELKACRPGIRTTLLPLSDGGDGFVETMTLARQGSIHTVSGSDVLGRRCLGRYGLLGDGTAIVDIAELSGLRRVPPGQRNPETTTNLGTGRLLARLVQAGARRILIGLGGSATTDGGIGLIAPLGFQFLDRRGNPLPPIGASLPLIDRIVPPEKSIRTEFIVATDVNNPLYGPRGASAQFGPQKGATPAQVRRQDAALRHFAEVVRRSLGHSSHTRPGAGAAGGCGYGLMTFLGARRVAGFDIFREWSSLDELIKTHDLIITGEGALDETSVSGKGPWEVAKLARSEGKQVWAICGICRLPARVRRPFDEVAELVSFAPSAEKAQRHAARYVRAATRELAGKAL